MVLPRSVVIAGVALVALAIGVVGWKDLRGSFRPTSPPPPSAIEVLHAWDRERAAAWAAGDPARLRALYVTDSQAGAADVALLKAYRARGLTVRGLTASFSRARVLAVGPRLLRVVVTERITGGRVGEVALPTTAPHTRVIELRKPARAWLVASVRPGF